MLLGQLAVEFSTVVVIIEGQAYLETPQNHSSQKNPLLKEILKMVPQCHKGHDSQEYMQMKKRFVPCMT